jgi:hypothetical protein
MATAACLPIAADRAGPCVRTIFFRGLDLAGVVLAMELRLNPETPGPAAVALGMGASANDEGLRVVAVTVTDGVPTSEVALRIAEATMKDAAKIPYAGEIGSSCPLYYDLIGVFGQDKRRLVYGTLTPLPTVYGMDNAPANRSAAFGASGGSGGTWTSALVSYSDDATSIVIDGADLLGPLVDKAGSAAASVLEVREALTALQPVDAAVQNGFFDINEQGRFSANAGFRAVRITGRAGDKGAVTSRVTAGALARVVFYDVLDKPISIVDPGQNGRVDEYTDQPFTFPEGAVAAGFSSDATGLVVKTERPLDGLASKVVSTTESLTALVDSGAALAVGFYAVDNGALDPSVAYQHVRVPIEGGARLRCTTTTSGSAMAMASFFGTDGAYLGPLHPGVDGVPTVYSDYEFEAPALAKSVAVTGLRTAPTRIAIPVVIDDVAERVIAMKPPLAGRRLLWLGTSIPAGYPFEGGASYPARVAAKLGATVNNQAQAASPARIGVVARRTATDPYGWTGSNWLNVALSLAMTVAEKNDLIDNWGSKWRDLLGGDGKPNVLDDPTKALWRGCSYENRLIPYLASTDLFIFDHGHNDWSMNPGGGSDGALAGPDGGDMLYLPSAANPPAYPDPLTGADPTRDRSTFRGAMAFLIDKILAANPRARIAFVGHYEDSPGRKPNIVVGQKAVAADWDFPLIPLWSLTGWSNQTIKSGPSAGKRLTEVWMPDDLHPGSDATGEANALIANILAAQFTAMVC